MPVHHHHHLLPTNDARHPGTGLLNALHQWRDRAWTATSGCHVPGHRTIDANRATIERAKARQTHTPVHTLAKTLVQGIALGRR